MTTDPPILDTSFPSLRFLRRGKVRDLYDLGEHLLIVATDRLSAFDVIMGQPIPDKGKILTQISNFWFSMMADLILHHLVETDVDRFPDVCRPYAETLRGRSVVVRKATPLPVECVARGYLSGSGWAEYRRSGSVCGVKLPPGLRESSPLPEPIFTPATKADVGHDENISFPRVESLLGSEIASRVRDHTLKIYRRAADYAATRGIILADTKLEFGMFEGSLILIDELLTPDSSRFWPRDSYSPGGPQKSFDKQFVRDYLLSVNFNGMPPPPPLPEDVIRTTSQLYHEALRKLTGSDMK